MEKREFLFLLDQFCKDIASYCFQVLRLPTYIRLKQNLKKNIKLKEIRTKDKCYIIGLGPSLKHVDFSKLEDGDLITVNSYYKDFHSINFKPMLHIMLDWCVYSRDRWDLEAALEAFPDSYFLLNGKYYEEILDKEKSFWTCTWGSENVKGEIDLTRLVPSFDNVICHAIYTAMYMGYKEIILLGCDFNSFASRKMTHSYGDEERFLRMDQELFAYSFVANSHMKLSRYASDKGINIINATYNSLIDAYQYDEELAVSLMEKMSDENN